MTKRSIAEGIYRSGKYPSIKKRKLYALLNAFFKMMGDMLIETGEVKLSGFGAFKVRRRKEKRGRDPRTGEMRIISSKNTVQFKPSKKLIARLNMLSRRSKI
ncbi:MAG: HU family DNA-binding protein [Aquificaceae bacterium]